jgi:UDP-2,4-diacetamido-2,4,6-trideoxy-beta-L-altropyranose hydrolase
VRCYGRVSRVGNLSPARGRVLVIAFRVDASLQIGTGHVMRCLTLAKVLRDRGKECVFLSRNYQGCLTELLLSQGFSVSPLPRPEDTQTMGDQPLLAHAHWLDVSWHTDALQTIEALCNRVVDWLIVDHYALDRRWESQLRPHTRKVMVIDDLADREHDCDVLLDQNLVANFETRYDPLVTESCARLLGPKYALLQSEYAELRFRAPLRTNPVARILVYFGGSDSHNLTGLTISVLLDLQHPQLKVDVVINPKSKNAEVVRVQVAGRANITLHENVPSLAPLMVNADLAIGAGGATTWERCCLGLPAIVVTVAENQVAIADWLHRAGLIRWLGAAENISAAILREAVEQAINFEDLKSWSSLCRSIVDGLAANRVASVVTLRSDIGLTARVAEAADETLLLNWVNDPLVRENSFRQSCISHETHRNWFMSRLKADGRVRMYIVETEDRLPVGQVRFELADLGWEIDFSIAHFARTKGLGTRLLNAAIKEFRSEVADALLIGYVKESNHASIRVFQKLGFRNTQLADYLMFTCSAPKLVSN